MAQLRHPGECGRGKSAEQGVSGEGEVEGVHGLDAEQFADEKSAAFAMEGADIV